MDENFGPQQSQPGWDIPFERPPTAPAAPATESGNAGTSGFLRGRRLSSAIVTGGAAFAMTLAGLGIASAQTDGSTPPADPPAASSEGHSLRPHGRAALGANLDAAATAIGISTADLRAGLRDGKSIATIATDNGKDVQTVIDALVADARTRLADRVADGDLTQARADTISENLVERMTTLVNRERGDRRPGRGPGHHPHLAASLDAAATAIGISVEDLRAGLREGKSIATIATENGKVVQVVIDAIVADASTRLTENVTEFVHREGRPGRR